ncbi:helix-turn-helix transcriptional regulator [Halorussus salinisoli]|uniref:helix-turn-helix transcriptional regulator n=1 Tax=Halorussus salinisoli TaxID=2558242 RepID=UPI0010C19159|nr:transcriptional regulator FilR1 domain-containing protein [Halorussus salinisoli]
MTTPLDDIAFLANSENRVTVLDALATTPRTRQDLLEELDVSRVTLARILRDCKARHWVEQKDEAYTVTPLGEWIYDEITDVLDVLETEHQLREVLPWFPIDDVDFEIEWLRDAEVVRPTESDPTTPIRRAAVQLRGGTSVRVLTMQVVASFFDIVGEPLVQGEMAFEAVATPRVYETITNDSRMAVAFRELANAEDVTFFVTDDVPFVLHVVDDSVLIGLVDDDGTPRAAIESADETIHAWAIDLFETYVRRAEPVTREAITA